MRNLDIDLANLRAKAEAATPGPWVFDQVEDVYNDEEPRGAFLIASTRDTERKSHENAEFIAAANPAIVIALLDRLAAAEPVAAPLVEPGRVELCDEVDCPVHGTNECELQQCISPACERTAAFCIECQKRVRNALEKERDGLSSALKASEAQAEADMGLIRKSRDDALKLESELRSKVAELESEQRLAATALGDFDIPSNSLAQDIERLHRALDEVNRERVELKGGRAAMREAWLSAKRELDDLRTALTATEGQRDEALAQLAEWEPVVSRVKRIRSLQLAPGIPDAERIVAGELGRQADAPTELRKP